MCACVCVTGKKGALLTHIECREEHDKFGSDESKIHGPYLQLSRTLFSITSTRAATSFASVMIS